MAVTIDRIIRNFNNRIEEPVRKHLRNVYACLTMSAAAAAFGTFLSIYTRILATGFLTTLAALGFLLALHLTSPNGKNNKLRLGYLLGFAFFSGVGMAPVINFAVAVNPQIILTAFVGTVFIFACFSLSVLFAPRGYWLFIAGPISTLLSTLFFLSLANIFFGSQWVYTLNLYLGLLGMCGFVIYDTTVIMERCRMNDKDFIGHSIDLLVDFICIFKKIVVLLTEREERNNRNKNNK